MYQQVLDPVANSLGWSALFAALPIVTLFVLLGVVRARAWVASLGALAVALGVSVVVYAMPGDQALLAASRGAAFGLFPLVWTFGTAVWIYRMTVETGHFDVLRRSFARISDDQRIQAIVVAFSFGSLLEALAGQGTPVAITTVMMLALGFRPMLAVTVALVANTVPAAFGPLGLPITTLAKVSELPADDLGAMAGRQVPIIAVFIPLIIVFLVGGRRGLREVWWPALAAGLSFGLAQFVTANYISFALADIVAALVSAAVVAVVVRGRRAVVVQAAPAVGAPVGVGAPTPGVGGGSVGDGGDRDELDRRADRRGEVPDTPGEVWRAYAPYLAIIAILVLSEWKPVNQALNAVTVLFDWPGLHLVTPDGETSTLPLFKFNWLASTGTLLLFAGLVTMVVLRISVRTAIATYGQTLHHLRWAILTVTGLLSLSFVMNASGHTATLGTWMAGAGGFFAVLSPILGWLGVALTGSDTSSNSLFGALQVTAAEKAGLDPTLLAAANASGGVVGKMISLQNLTIAASAVGLSGQEGVLFRRMFGWSLLLLSGMCLIVALQATPVLAWMVP